MHECQPTSLGQIRAVRQLAYSEAVTEVERVRGKLAIRKKPWNREYRDTDAYDKTFSPVLPDGIVHTLRQLKAPEKKFVVMDIMGTGSVFENLPPDVRPDIVIAMTLVDYRTPEEIQAEEKKRIYVIGTNKDDLNEIPTSVTLPSTWIRFEKLLKELQIDYIDFAVARPLGGMHTIPSEFLWFLAWMGQKVYKHLNPNGGIFLTEGPQNQNESLLNWAEITRRKGFDVECRLIIKDNDFQPIRSALKITRHPNSPTSLTQI